MPIVKEVDIPRFPLPNPIIAKAPEIQVQTTDENSSINKAFLRVNKLLVTYSWWILGAFFVVIIGILLSMGIFGRLTSNFLENFYKMCLMATKQNLPTVI